jgi:hypothetical protein
MEVVLNALSVDPDHRLVGGQGGEGEDMCDDARMDLVHSHIESVAAQSAHIATCKYTRLEAAEAELCAAVILAMIDPAAVFAAVDQC